MIRIYGYDDCPFCKKAAALLTEERMAFHYVPIPSQEGRKMFMDQRGFTGTDRTFPRVYKLVGGEEVLVGGYSELESKVLLGDL